MMVRSKLIALVACLLALGTQWGCSQNAQESGAAQGAAGASSLPPERGDDDFSGAAGTGSSFGSGGSSASAGAAGTAGMGSFSGPGESDFGAGASAGTGGAGGSSAPPLDPSSEAGTGSVAPVQPSSGTLTAGAWDDNRNFERFSDYRSELLQGGSVAGAMPTTDLEHADAHEQFAELPGARSKLDIALVIDTTGSMVDEIAYLQTELSAISQAIEASYPNAEQRWALTVYRDEGDAYVVRTFDFTADVQALRTSLLQQSADGGGDFPEAPDAALEATNAFAWRSGGDVARLAFLVADAPHHSHKAEALKDAVLEAQALGVHIYPVASSGIDELTELTMRSAAQLTGGRYLFLTNDSGVGGDHKEPTIPCYFVTKLDDAIVRMVDIEMSGEYREPAADEILRKGGDPENGACRLENGDEVEVF